MSSSDHDIIEISSESGEQSRNESDGEEKNPQPITKQVKKKLTRTRNKQKPSGHIKIVSSKRNLVTASKASIDKKSFGKELIAFTREQPNQTVLQPIPQNLATRSNTGSTDLTLSRINIFDNDFLTHNQSVEQELKTLRKNLSHIESHNGLADLANERLKAGITKKEQENEALENQNLELELRLRNLQRDVGGSRLSHDVVFLSDDEEIERVHSR